MMYVFHIKFSISRKLSQVASNIFKNIHEQNANKEINITYSHIPHLNLQSKSQMLYLYFSTNINRAYSVPGPHNLGHKFTSLSNKPKDKRWFDILPEFQTTKLSRHFCVQKHTNNSKCPLVHAITTALHLPNQSVC